MRIAANAPDGMAVHADRPGALIVTGGASRDVAACSGSVELAGAGKGPAWRVWVARIGCQGSQVLRAMTAIAKRSAVATAAQRRVGRGLDLMTSDKIVAVDEAAVETLWEQE